MARLACWIIFFFHFVQAIQVNKDDTKNDKNEIHFCGTLGQNGSQVGFLVKGKPVIDASVQVNRQRWNSQNWPL